MRFLNLNDLAPLGIEEEGFWAAVNTLWADVINYLIIIEWRLVK
jgi:hypothetical protein